MIFGSDRNNLRKLWFEVYRKAQAGEPLTALEEQIKAVIALHPEYHKALAHPERYAMQDYLPEFGEVNPFLHMGLHMGLREQLSTDRPAGIAALYAQACLRFGDKHVAEHMLMDGLAEALWEAQRSGKMPDEQRYLQSIRSRLEHGGGT